MTDLERLRNAAATAVKAIRGELNDETQSDGETYWKIGLHVDELAASVIASIGHRGQAKQESPAERMASALERINGQLKTLARCAEHSTDAEVDP